MSNFLFFKKKTAYEMRISEGSSDVCSSDLGYQDKNNASVSDQTAFLGLQALGIPFVGSQSQAVEGYSTEIRFASNSGGFFDYLLGLSYANRDETLETLIDANLLALPRELANTLFTSLGLTPPVILGAPRLIHEQIGRASCWERVCQYV